MRFQKIELLHFAGQSIYFETYSMENKYDTIVFKKNKLQPFDVYR